MSDAASEFDHLITEHRPALDGEGLPPWVRCRVVAYVDQCLGRGAKISSLQ
jgi:hypothetical protein